MAASAELDTTSESQSTPEIIVASTPSTIRKKRRSETDILVAEQYAQEEDHHRLSQTLSEIAENEDRSEERRREAERRLNREHDIVQRFLDQGFRYVEPETIQRVDEAADMQPEAVLQMDKLNRVDPLRSILI
mmetsp:Transcript_14049/g.42309  ORF Transcript_14049/g.42309 Transcript_14049/m.42309 type:complete len:133 (-) Transcript_14049:639-1037(-)